MKHTKYIAYCRYCKGAYLLDNDLNDSIRITSEMQLLEIKSIAKRFGYTIEVLKTPCLQRECKELRELHKRVMNSLEQKVRLDEHLEK